MARAETIHRKQKRQPGRHNPVKGSRQIEVQEITRDALALRRAGHSYRTIAAELGQPLSQVFKLTQAAIRDIPKEEADELRALEQERLDMALERLEDAAIGGDVRAIAEQRLIGESRRRLLGLDAPTKGEVEIATKLPDDVAALKDRLAKLLEGGKDDQATAPDRDPGDGAGGSAPGAGLVGQDEPKR